MLADLIRVFIEDLRAKVEDWQRARNAGGSAHKNDTEIPVFGRSTR